MYARAIWLLDATDCDGPLSHLRQ